MALGEFSLIRQYFQRHTPHHEGVDLSIGDDAALLTVPVGHQLVVSTDSLVAGTHFLPDAKPDWVGHKALASNISDIIAMGATPRWVSLALTLPTVDETWLSGFCDGFFALADHYGVSLIGGDTTQGPLSITLTIHGTIEHGKAWRRDGAKAGDGIYLSAPLGESKAGLSYILDPALNHPLQEALIEAHFKRWPNAALADQLKGQVHSALDISDGLIADLGHILAASGVGAIIDSDVLPLSDLLLAHCNGDQTRAKQLALTSGEEYALCLTLADEVAAQRAGLYRIGTVTDQMTQLQVLAGGVPVAWSLSGFDHFGV